MWVSALGKAWAEGCRKKRERPGIWEGKSRIIEGEGGGGVDSGLFRKALGGSNGRWASPREEQAASGQILLFRE